MVEHRLLAEIVADAGILGAAEGQGGVQHIVDIDPDIAGLEPPDEAMDAADVARPDAGTEAIFGIVGIFQCLGLVSEFRGDEDRTESDPSPSPLETRTSKARS